VALYPKGIEFFKYSHQVAEGMSGKNSVLVVLVGVG
jgi:hypothetical protein